MYAALWWVQRSRFKSFEQLVPFSNSNVPFSKSFELLNSSHFLLYRFPSWFLSAGQHFGSSTRWTRLLRQSYFGCLLVVQDPVGFGWFFFKAGTVCETFLRKRVENSSECENTTSETLKTHKAARGFTPTVSFDVTSSRARGIWVTDCVANPLCLTCFAGGVPVTECLSLFFVGKVCTKPSKTKTRESELFKTSNRLEND